MLFHLVEGVISASNADKVETLLGSSHQSDFLRITEQMFKATHVVCLVGYEHVESIEVVIHGLAIEHRFGLLLNLT